MIAYVKGDATVPIGEGNKLIIHICNDVGAWGAGFVMALSRRWECPEIQYRDWKRGIYEEPFALGHVQPVRVEADIYVCNMIAQHGVGFHEEKPPIRYDALKQCLERVARIAKTLNASTHMPRIGCGLAGGTWDVIGKMVEEELGEFSVTVYDL